MKTVAYRAFGGQHLKGRADTGAELVRDPVPLLHGVFQKEIVTEISQSLFFI
jgi:hypothetical protein